MVNFKVSGIAAGIAFVLSMLAGFIRGVSFFVVFSRALVFAALFFALAGIVFYLITHFIPELLSGAEEPLDLGMLGDAPAGSRVDISIGSETFDGAFPAEGGEDIDNIENALNTGEAAGGRPPSGGIPGLSGDDFGGGLDQNEKSGYTGTGKMGAGPASEAMPAPEKTAGAADVDLMPDFDSLSAAFLPNSGEGGGNAPAEGTEAPVFGNSVFETSLSTSAEPGRPASASKSDAFEEFDPKELAQAIQTVLKKEEQGY